MEVYLEVGSQRTFAAALDWPGWCRSGRDENLALQALLARAPRYAGVIRSTPYEFSPPADVAGYTVIERLAGDATTDFGAPGGIPGADARPVDDAELKRLQALVDSCWPAFVEAIEAATGRELRKGPRGGGRDVPGIFRHVLDSTAGYLSSAGWKLARSEGADPAQELARAQQAVSAALAAAAHGEVAPRGPRGGARWPPRYLARRLAWHVLDHAWEIEDRMI